MKDTFHRMIHAKVFTKLDLLKGFYQIEIHPDHRYLTAFTTNIGKFEFDRPPFGLLNAPKFFHNVIIETLEGIPNITIFVDDILITTESVEENIQTLKTVLKRLAERNIVINIQKSEFC